MKYNKILLEYGITKKQFDNGKDIVCNNFKGKVILLILV